MAGNDEQISPGSRNHRSRGVAARGSIRVTSTPEILILAGDRAPAFLVVLSARLEINQPGPKKETLVVTYGRGQFTGEGLLSLPPTCTGRRSSGLG